MTKAKLLMFEQPDPVAKTEGDVDQLMIRLRGLTVRHHCTFERPQFQSGVEPSAPIVETIRASSYFSPVSASRINHLLGAGRSTVLNVRSATLSVWPDHLPADDNFITIFEHGFARGPGRLTLVHSVAYLWRANFNQIAST